MGSDWMHFIKYWTLVQYCFFLSHTLSVASFVPILLDFKLKITISTYESRTYCISIFKYRTQSLLLPCRVYSQNRCMWGFKCLHHAWSGCISDHDWLPKTYQWLCTCLKLVSRETFSNKNVKDNPLCQTAQVLFCTMKISNVE